MEWKPGSISSDIEDRRNESGSHYHAANKDGIFARLEGAIANAVSNLGSAATVATADAEFKLGRTLAKHAGGSDSALGKAESHAGIALMQNAVLVLKAEAVIANKNVPVLRQNENHAGTVTIIHGGESVHSAPKPSATPATPKPAKPSNLREV